MSQEKLPHKEQDESSGINAAARWLADHREVVRGAIIPFLRREFHLTTLEAIEAAKLAHRLQHDPRSA